MSLVELGSQMRAERERRGLSMEMVASHLKISQRVLRALEEGDESSLPQGVYLRGFLRSYGSMLEIDTATISEQLASMPVAEEVPMTPIHMVPQRSMPRGIGTLFVFLLIFSCLVGGGYWYYRTVLTVGLVAESENPEISLPQHEPQTSSVPAAIPAPALQTTLAEESKAPSAAPAPLPRLSVQSPYEKNVSSSTEGSMDLDTPVKQAGKRTDSLVDLDSTALEKLPVSENSRISGSAPATASTADTATGAQMRADQKTVASAPDSARPASGTPPGSGSAPVTEKTPVPKTANSLLSTAPTGISVLSASDAGTEKTGSAMPALAEGGAYKMIVTALEECWIRSEADGTARREFALHKGETFALAFNKKLVLLLGNAGGVRLRFNGEELPEPGKRGQVKTLVFPPE